MRVFRTRSARIVGGCLGALLWLAGRLPIAAVEPVPEGSFDPTIPGIPARNLYRQRVYRRDDGLPSDTVYALLVGRDRLLWIGTAAGLARFDGREFRVYDHVSHPEFTSDAVTALGEGPDGALWVGTRDGLLEFRDGRVRKRYAEADGIKGAEITTVRVRHNGEIWFGTQWAIHRLHDGGVQAWTNLFGVPANDRGLRQIFEDGANRLYVVGPAAPVLSWNDETSRFEPVGPPGGDPIRFGATGIVEDRAGRLWLGGVRPLVRDLTGWRTSVLGKDPLFPEGFLLHLDRWGTVWANGWDDGILAYRGKRSRRFTLVDGLSATPAYAVTEDHEGALWIGTDSGLNRWQPRRIPTLSMADGLPDESVWAFAEGPDGAVWIGTDFGVARCRPDGRIDRPIGALASPRVRSLHFDAQGTLWIGTAGSVESWRDGEQTRHRWEEESALNKVRVVTSDSAGRIWVGRERGLMCFSGGQWWRYTTGDGLPTDDVRALRFDSSGRLWIATYGGGVAVAEVAPQTGPVSAGQGAAPVPAKGGPPPGLRIVGRLSVAEGLPSNFAWAFLPDDAGRMWVGTERGMARLGWNETTGPRVDGSVGRAQGLHQEAVNELLSDGQGWVWLGTDRGIARVRKTELDAAVEGRATRVSCFVYGEADGLPSGETNGQKSQPAGLRTRSGEIWFPTTRGVVRIDPRAIEELETPAVAVLKRIQIDGEDVFELGPGRESLDLPAIRLAPGRARVLAVEFEAVTFREPRRLRFRHRLIGFETNWADAGDRTVAFYTNLEPGRYRFEVEAAVNHDVWSRSPAAFDFELAPRFYRTGTFRLAVATGALATLILVVLWRERERDRLAGLRRQVELAQERQRIARDMHDDLGAGLTRLVLLGDHARRQAPPEAATVLPVLDRVGGEASRLVDQLGELVWATNPDFDDLGSVLARLREYAAGFLADSGLTGVLDFPDANPSSSERVSGSLRKNLVLAFKEALTNAVRHSGARRIEVTARFDEGWLDLTITDDGHGFVPGSAPGNGGTGGNGLANMRLRLERVGGKCTITSEAGRGTTVRLGAPLSAPLS